MKYQITSRNTCRACNSKDLFCFMNLPDLPLPLGHTPPGKEGEAFRSTLALYWCSECLLVQTLQDVDLSDYYSDYSYSVSASPLVQEFMQEFARQIWTLFKFQKEDVVLEIGSSDGLQLEYFQKMGARVLGFEPSKELARISEKRNIKTIPLLFTENTMVNIPSSYKPVQVAITQYTFDHLPEPIPMLKSIAKVLDPKRGIIVIEVHDFEKIVERNEACLFTHEHATYATAESMESILKQVNMKLVSSHFLDEIHKRGNSLIVVGAMTTNPINSFPEDKSDLLKSLRKRETYIPFADNIRQSHKRLADHVREMKKQGKRVAGYGGVGRGVNTLVIAGLNANDVECVYDQNKKLHGLLMPGSGVMVKPPEDVFENPVDEIIVFSYGYMDEIKKFMRPYLDRGGRITSMLEYLRNHA